MGKILKLKDMEKKFKWVNLGNIMSDDPNYGKRKSKGDKKAKTRYTKYKKGGKRRAGKIEK